MAEITAALVKELREKTGAGMMDCKKALGEANGDMEAAVDWLRAKGLAAAQKKAGRVAAEGLVAAIAEGARGAAVEVNAETDFVARNELFQDFVGNVARLALGAGGDVEKLKSAAYPGTGRTVAEELTQRIAKIGENMTLRRTAALSVGQGVVRAYVHSAVKPGMGRIAVLVALESAAAQDKLDNLAKLLALHVAAAAPRALSVAELDPALVERERAVLTEQARESGKPAEVVAKMVEGRLRKFYQDVVLLEQTWVHDGESRVAKIVEQAAKEAGAPIEVAAFVRYALGEGIEREKSDFAAEVAAQAAR
jgi:elongation factor Ts